MLQEGETDGAVAVYFVERIRVVTPFSPEEDLSY